MEQDCNAVFYVRDDGVGFDMADSDTLFGLFQSLHPAEEFESSGLGLATARQVVRRHDGTVWAEGKVGSGAMVYFSLSRSTRNVGP